MTVLGTLLWPIGKLVRIIDIYTREAENATDHGAQVYHIGLTALTNKRCSDVKREDVARASPKRQNVRGERVCEVPKIS
jgi:hypothetical protein